MNKKMIYWICFDAQNYQLFDMISKCRLFSQKCASRFKEIKKKYLRKI